MRRRPVPPHDTLRAARLKEFQTMSIFGTILSTIFSHAGATPPAASPKAAQVTDEVPEPAAAPATPPAEAQVTQAVPEQAAAPARPVDVAAILTSLAEKTPQPLNWRQSIVDLLKLLNLDSSLAARKQLAEELHYSGDTTDSATMNIWLHRAVMQKLADNGGKVPDDLK
jgi:Domain of unknown function (DUF3597)